MTLDEVVCQSIQYCCRREAGARRRHGDVRFGNRQRCWVTDIVPDAKVKSAMNDINAAQREQVAANARGEAEKILVVKKAEAEAESKALQGQGIANQRKAIIEGLQGSIEQFQRVSHRGCDRGRVDAARSCSPNISSTIESIGELDGDQHAVLVAFARRGPRHLRADPAVGADRGAREGVVAEICTFQATVARRSRSALATTLTEDSAMAAAAIARRQQAGRRPDTARRPRSARRRRCKGRQRTDSAGCCAWSLADRRAGTSLCPERSPLRSVTPALCMATSVPVAHGNSDIGGSERRRVVDAVARDGRRHGLGVAAFGPTSLLCSGDTSASYPASMPSFSLLIGAGDLIVAG